MMKRQRGKNKIKNEKQDQNENPRLGRREKTVKISSPNSNRIWKLKYIPRS